jgi:DNA-binding MarR family transcriptional regulator
MTTKDDKSFNINRYRMSHTVRSEPTRIHQKTYPKQTVPFLKGPVPIWWLSQACGLRGKALAVGVALWYMSGLTRKTPIKATRKLWRQFEINRKSASRGIKALEKTGLITVVRNPGCAPLITIVTEQQSSKAGIAA